MITASEPVTFAINPGSTSEEFPRGNGSKQHERAIAFIKERRRALDIGCGSSGRFIDLLTSHGFDAEGADGSDQMIKLAMQRHPGITFNHADVGRLDSPRRHDFISASDSIWHLP